MVTSQAIKKIYDRTFLSEIDCLCFQNLLLRDAHGLPGRSGGEFEFRFNSRSEQDPESFTVTEQLLDSGCPSTDPHVQLASDLGRFPPLFLRFSIENAENAPFFVHFNKK